MMTRILAALALVLLGGCVKKEVSSKIPGDERKPQPPPKERILTLNAKPLIEEEGDADFKYHALVIGKGDSEKSMIWPYDAPEPAKIPSDRVLQMEVVEITKKPLMEDMPESMMISYELSKLTDGSRVLYDASVCRAHDMKMERRAVPISYGLPYRPPGFKEASEDFPHDGTVLGGCVVSEETHTHVWVCSKCEERSKAWWEQNLPNR